MTLDPPLHADEVVLERRRPLLKVFLQRILFVFAAWAVFFTIPTLPTVLGILANPSWTGLIHLGYGMLGTAIWTVFFMYIFNDFAGWSRVRGDVWTVTNHRLILQSNDYDTPAETQWSEVTSIKTHWFWAIRLRLENHQAILIRYIGYRTQLVNVMRAQVQLYQQGAQSA